MKKLTYIAALAGMIIIPAASFAQEAENTGLMSRAWNLDSGILWGIYVLIAVLLILTVFLFRISNALVGYLKGEEEKERQSFWGSLFQVRSTSTDKDVMMDHSYDGITELDNPAPPWFMWLFYSTVIFAIVYFVRFSITGSGPTQEEEYLAEVAAHEAMLEKGGSGEKGGMNDNDVVMLAEAVDLKSGAEIYTDKCVACHGDQGQGNIGPNLTDQYWLHGGSFTDVYKTIKYGVIEKGMQSWQFQLKPKEMQQVASYIMTMQGSNPPNPKDPEGELYTPEAPTNEPADTTLADNQSQASL
jgi:cytochrome c oxidase cbb3-type subunit 3